MENAGRRYSTDFDNPPFARSPLMAMPVVRKTPKEPEQRILCVSDSGNGVCRNLSREIGKMEAARIMTGNQPGGSDVYP
ncbi:MAG: hypothetical protein ACLT46_01340 [Hungatella sp.]